MPVVVSPFGNNNITNETGLNGKTTSPSIQDDGGFWNVSSNDTQYNQIKISWHFFDRIDIISIFI